VAGKQLPFEVVLRVDGVVTFQVSLDIPGLHIVATTNLVASRQQNLNVIHRVESSALFQVDELISLGLLQVSSQSIEEQGLPGELVGALDWFNCRERLGDSFSRLYKLLLCGLGILT